MFKLPRLDAGFLFLSATIFTSSAFGQCYIVGSADCRDFNEPEFCSDTACEDYWVHGYYCPDPTLALQVFNRSFDYPDDITGEIDQQNGWDDWTSSSTYTTCARLCPKSLIPVNRAGQFFGGSDRSLRA